MMTMEQTIGDIVLIMFREPDRYRELGVVGISSHFKIAGYDQFGIWVDHPGLLWIQAEDENGRPLPADQQKRENIAATFLITWDNIQSLMHYPKREGYDFPSEFDKDFGFKIKPLTEQGND